MMIERVFEPHQLQTVFRVSLHALSRLVSSRLGSSRPALNAPCQILCYIVVGLCVAIARASSPPFGVCNQVPFLLQNLFRRFDFDNFVLLFGAFSCIRVVVCCFWFEGEFGIGLLCFVVLGI